MSEAELHVLRARSRGGSLHKAGEGELRLPLPAGYEYDEQGAVRTTPDEAVADAIASVFSYFEELASARQVMLRLLEQQRKLPRRSQQRPPAALGAGDLQRDPRHPDQPDPRHPDQPGVCGRLRVWAQAHRAARGERRRARASASRAARGVARVHSRTTTPATSRSSATSAVRSGCGRTGARRAGRAAALRARAKRCCKD
jgi:hypothetical protein